MSAPPLVLEEIVGALSRDYGVHPYSKWRGAHWRLASLVEIAPDRLETPFLFNPTLVSGLGQNFIYPADMLPEYVVSFHRVGKTIQLIKRNTLFQASAASSM